MSDIEERLNNLEMKYSYQDELVSELNLIVADQQKKIDDLMKLLKELNEQGPSGELDPNERPPHY